MLGVKVRKNYLTKSSVVILIKFLLTLIRNDIYNGHMNLKIEILLNNGEMK